MISCLTQQMTNDDSFLHLLRTLSGINVQYLIKQITLRTTGCHVYSQKISRLYHLLPVNDFPKFTPCNEQEERQNKIDDSSSFGAGLRVNLNYELLSAKYDRYQPIHSKLQATNETLVRQRRKAPTSCNGKS